MREKIGEDPNPEIGDPHKAYNPWNDLQVNVYVLHGLPASVSGHVKIA
jgi:hypothetical protein